MRVQDARFLLATQTPGDVEPCACEVAMVGRSNVGKSSLINALCQRKHLAKVSNTPGKTRTLNVYTIGLDRWLVDLPGYGYAQKSVAERNRWKRLIEQYLLSRPSLKRVFVVVDAVVGPTDLDIQMVDWLYSKHLSYNILANKADKIKPSYRQAGKKSAAEAFGLKPEDISLVSAETLMGIDEIRDAVTYMLEL